MTTDQNDNSKFETRCLYCQTEATSDHFCQDCGRIQPILNEASYFEFFGLPARFLMDEAVLEKSFHALCRQFHPDYYMNASEAEREASVDRSSRLNDAYRTLRDHVTRAQYLLSMMGLTTLEKKAPPELLEEVFEMNMELEEMNAARKMGDEDEVAQLKIQLEEALVNLQQKTQDIDNRLRELYSGWDGMADSSEDSDESRRLLVRINELLSHRSYISNLLNDIKENL